MIFISWAGPFYRFDGWYFEVHRRFGPMPLNKNGDVRKAPPGRKFWRMWDKFSALPDLEREKYRADSEVREG